MQITALTITTLRIAVTSPSAALPAAAGVALIAAIAAVVGPALRAVLGAKVELPDSQAGREHRTAALIGCIRSVVARVSHFLGFTRSRGDRTATSLRPTEI